jgi:hypothetical protein
MNYITLKPMVSRIGTNILYYISYIIFAYKNKLLIKYNKNELFYSDSIFVNILFNYIDNYNKELLNNNFIGKLDNKISIELYDDDLMKCLSYTTINIKSDIISYFHNFIYKHIKNELPINILSNKYKIPFDINKTIIVHLRLDDVTYRVDYDATIPTNYYKNQIDNNELCITSDLPRHLTTQTPIAIDRIQNEINKALLKYSGYEVVIIASPEPKDYIIPLPYRCIRSDDPEFDLFLLCSAKVLILSRSTFAIISCFLGTAEEIYCPLWAINVSLGLYTKYDNSKYNYFY